MAMKHSQDTLKKHLLKNVTGGKRTNIDLDPVLARIEEEMERILQTMPMASLIAEGILPSRPTTSSLFDLQFKMMDKILDNSFSSQVSLDDVAESLVNQDACQHSRPELSVPREELQQLTIASLGCITLLFSWHEARLLRHCSITGGSSLEQSNLHLENCSKAIGSFIPLFGLLPSPYAKEPDLKKLLYLSALNYHSLTHIDRLRIEWVPHLSQDLVLVISNRALRLFKYPSICALALMGGDYQELNQRVIKDGNDKAAHSLHREVLLSLRFILGQTRKSRGLAHKLAISSIPAENRDAAFAALLKGDLDHLLRPPSGSVVAEKLVRQDFLTRWTDFPLLGARLLEIQQYNMEQRPTKTSKMIRDKRDPARWYTLWEVLLIGGLSIILSALQLDVSCAQLAYATKAPS